MIAVIGAGPAGSFTAYKLAEQGHKVAVFEEHSEIGKPVQCTGIVTSAINEIMKLPEEVVVNKLTRTRLHAPNGEIADIRINPNLVIERAAFDAWLADLAKRQGAKFFLGHRFIEGDDSHIKVRRTLDGKLQDFSYDKLVGADGPSSKVARVFNLGGVGEKYIGVQARMRLETDKRSFECHFGKIVPGFFGWIVPEDDQTARVGLATKTKAHERFHKFAKDVAGKDYRSRIMEMQGGVIPIYDPSIKVQKDNVFLVGDAASQIKSTTGGGIVPGLKAAEILADCIASGRSYERGLKKKIGADMRIHLKVRNILDRFSDDDYNLMIKLCQSEKVRRVFGRYDRDNPKSLLPNVLLKEPKFLYFIKRMFW